MQVDDVGYIDDSDGDAGEIANQHDVVGDGLGVPLVLEHLHGVVGHAGYGEVRCGGLRWVWSGLEWCGYGVVQWGAGAP